MNAPAPAPDPRAAKAAPAPGLRFVARQPILTKDEKVFGYELLFRDGIEDYLCTNDVEAASKTMLDSSLIMGLDVLCKGGRAFVNCTRDMLLHVRNRECAAGSVPPSGAAILISPGAIALQPGQQQQFAAAVSGLSRAAVTWSATGGTITSAGRYTAPSSAGSYTVTATSAASRRRSTAAMVTCNPAVVTVTLPNPPPVTSAVQVSVSLSAASMQPGAQQQFSALVSGTSNMAVTWSAASGSIAANGLYTAPANAGTYTITAVSNGDPTKSASALAVVSAPQTVTISIAPATASVSEASHLQFTAAVSGISNNAVTWAVTRGVARSRNQVCIPLRGPRKMMSSPPPVRPTTPSQPTPRLRFLSRTRLP